MISKEAFVDIIALKRSGLSIREIARKLGMHRKTVKKYLEGNSFPAYRREKKPTVLEPYHQIVKDFLDEDDYKEKKEKRGHSLLYTTPSPPRPSP